LLGQSVGNASGRIGDQAFSKAFRNYFLDLLANQFVAPISELSLDLCIYQDNLPSLVHHHHCIRGRFQ